MTALRRTSRLVLGSLLLLLAAGCVFDQDDGFVPAQRSAWLIVRQAGENRLLVAFANAADLQTATDLNLTGEPQHVAARDQTVYLLTDNLLSRRDGVLGVERGREGVDAGSRYVVPTEAGVYVLQPARNQVQVLAQVRGDNGRIAVALAPEVGVATTGKLLLAGGGQVQWLDERALTPQPEVATVPAGPVRVERDAVGRVRLLIGPTSNALDVVGGDPRNLSLGSPSRLDALDQWVSPYLRQQYGREYLGTVTLRANGVVADARGTLLTGATSLAVDMAQSYAWVTARDSLLQVDLVTRQRVRGWALGGSGVIRHAAFVQAAER